MILSTKAGIFVLVYCTCPVLDILNTTPVLSPINELFITQLPVAFCRPYNLYCAYKLPLVAVKETATIDS